MCSKQAHVEIPGKAGEGKGILIPTGVVVEFAKGKAEDGDAVAGRVGGGFDQAEKGIGGGVEFEGVHVKSPISINALVAISPMGPSNSV